MSTLNEKLNELSPERRRRVQARAEDLIAQEATRRELSRALKQAQASVVKQIGPERERDTGADPREDLLISTLNKYVCARGGKLSLVVEFPEGDPVLLTGIGALEDDYDDGDWGGFRYETLDACWQDLARHRFDQAPTST